jgi:hypothetical protein
MNISITLEGFSTYCQNNIFAGFSIDVLTILVTFQTNKVQVLKQNNLNDYL